MIPRVGMKVRIRPDLKAGQCNDFKPQSVIDEMLEFKGMLATVTRVDASNREFFIDLDGGDCRWNRKMLAPTSILKARPCNRK